MSEYLNIALPKGRLGQRVYSLFEQAGYDCDDLKTGDPGRKLIFENNLLNINFFWVKPSDVHVYVERGAADIGAAGKDILDEYNPDVYELLDLKTGICKMAVAAPEKFIEEPDKVLRVATEFPNIAAKYYAGLGRDIDIIKLKGSLEIAPIIGLADVIVDIVETGTTLRENNLIIKDIIMDISARLIVNKSSFNFKFKRINELINKLNFNIEKIKK
ncbi:MAG: ATP phosphoribosyltransferase [Synergistaceae bacterium]|nr:ATP phosphoribosyltransferase [Synergistaceae bacterium]